MLTTHKFFVFFVLAIALILVAYYPALDVGFYLDDYDSIVNNPVLANPSWEFLNTWFSMRQLGYATLLMDYQFWGLNAFGYHLSNLFFHFFVVLSLYWFVSLLSKAAQLDLEKFKWLPIATALLFAVVSLNSQAVIYAVQRLAILAALFYVLGMASYLKFRLTENKSRAIWLIITLLCFIAGMLTKQNVITFPIALFLLEVTIFKSRLRSKTPLLILSAILLVLLIQLLDFATASGVFQKLNRLTMETTDITRWQYLSHQFYVHWLYIGKFFYPSPLRLEYSIHLYDWSHYQVWCGFLATCLVLLLAWKIKTKHLVIFLCVFLFYLLHIVESGVIPIRDYIFEHRAYLPNVVMCLLVSYLFFEFLRGYQKLALSLGALILLTYTFITHQRALLWQEPIEFYRHEMVHEGESSRLYGSLAAKFAQRGDEFNAYKWFRIAMKVGQDTGVLQANTVVSYIDLLNKRGDEGRAKYFGVKAINLTRRHKDKADILAVMAKLDVAQGQCRDALGMINRALRYDPNNINANYLKLQCNQQLSAQE